MEKLIKVIRTDTFKSSSVTFVGSVINGVLGALFFVLTARFLGPVNFGILTVAITIITLTVDISDLGVDTGLVRFVGKYANNDPKKANKFLKLGLKIKLIVGFVVLLLGIALSDFIAKTIFFKPDLIIPIRIASLGVLGALLFDYVTHALQAYQKFYHWSGLYIFTNLIRILLVLLVAGLNFIDVNNMLWVYIAMPFLGFGLGIYFLPRDFLKSKNENSIYKEFFHYNKWVALMSIVAATSSRLDTFITARLLTLDQVGIYSAANQLVRFVPQLASAMGTVIAPKMASKNKLEDMVLYLKKAQLLVGGISLAGIASIPLAIFFIPVFFGPSFQASVPVFIVLLIAMLIFLFSIPIHNAIFYYFSEPKLFFYLAIGHLMVISAFSWYLIGIFGVMGASYAVLIGSIFNFLIPAGYVYYKISKR